MSYQGDIRLGDTLDFKFTTTSASTGAPTTLSGTPVISAYVGNSTTQITAGITLSVDFDSVTGLNNVRVVASSGNGFAAGSNVSLVITTGTVGGTSAVGYEVGSFSIENRSALRPTNAGRTLDVSSGGEAGVDWANVGSPTTTVGLSGTTISTTQAVASVSGAVGSVTGNVGGNVVGSVASVTGAVGSVTGNVGGNVVGTIGGLSTQAKTDVGDGAWDATLADHLDSGSTGAALNAAGSAGDPWSTALPGSYGAGTAGNIIGNRIDAATSSRMASYTQPTGFLAATFPTTVASPTNITAGTITTVTNLTNAPTSGDFTSTMKTSLNAATPASVTGAVGSVTGNVGGNVVGSVGSVTGNVGGNVVGSVASVTGAVGSVTGNVGGNVAGSVASVTGAVGSVTATVDANVVEINDTTITGDGASTPWGPA